MERNKKAGLDYFPFDINLFQDIKIRKLIKYQGGKAITVYALLLCIIYKDGYYVRWDEELPFIISEQSGFEEAYILEVIKSCMKLGLFSKELYDSDKVLTSKGIQERYKKTCDLCRRNSDIDEFSLISSEEKPETSTDVDVKKLDAVKAATLKRRDAFYNSLIPYVWQYGKEMVRDFFDYWSELNKSGTKMKFETNKTWETSKRLATWAKRKKEYESKNIGSNSSKERDMEEFYRGIASGLARNAYEESK